MSSTPTAEERADERFPSYISVAECLAYNPGVELAPNRLSREVYLACIREEVEPLEAENVKLRALVQELVEGCHEACEMQLGQRGSYDDVLVNLPKCVSGLDAALAQGFTPTNTTEG